jgi:hypothetical protein
LAERRGGRTLLHTAAAGGRAAVLGPLDAAAEAAGLLQAWLAVWPQLRAARRDALR